MRHWLHQLWQQCLITADEATTRSVRALRPSSPGNNNPLRLVPLEPRVLFSATPIDPAMMDSGDETAMVATVELEAASAAAESTIDATTTLVEAAPNEIVIIDPSVDDIDQLLDDLHASERNLEVFVLDAQRDGVDQITEILEGRSDVDSLHIVSHSESGSVRLGNTWLGENNLEGYAGAIAGWQGSLSADADILFYGCDLAGEQAGRELVESLGVLTGADVAASIDDTGHARYGGNWDLEFTRGDIETAIAFSTEIQQNWDGKLATITVTTFADVIDGGDGLTSLREAIQTANGGGGGDTIVLSAGTYLLDELGDGEGAALTGDLDILLSVTIVGDSAGTTVIDASGMSAVPDRIFEVLSGSTLTLNNLTLTGGDGGGSGGGAVLVSTGTTLITNDVIIAGNDGNNGGALQNNGTFNATFTTFDNNSGNSGAAIDNSGTMTLTDVAIIGNTATNAGGGIRNNGDATLTSVTLSGNSANQGGAIHHGGGGAFMDLTNVTISGNSATTSGGAIYTNRNIDTTNVTIAFNQVTTAVTGTGGGVFVSGGGGDLTMRNTILYNNTADVGANSNTALFSSGNNISDSQAITSAQPGDQLDVDPNLDPILRDNGGYTKTHALLAGSIAIDTGTATSAPVVDQRGFARPQDGDGNASFVHDIGAFELMSNLAPSINDNRLPVGQGSSVVLTASELSATDPDGPDGDLTFTVSNVAGGYFDRVSAATIPITIFNQSEITAGDIRFVHDGTNSAPGYDVEVSDGSDTDGPYAAEIRFFREALWISTSADVAGSGTLGLTNWSDSTVLEISDPNFSLEPGTTNGTFIGVFDLTAFGASSDVELTSLHVVSKTVTVDGSITLQAGDVLFSVNGGQPTLTSSNSVSMNKSDVVRFRPDTPGDYSVGTFEMVLDDPLLANANIGGVSLVERDTKIGDYWVYEGDFLLVETKGVDNVIHHFDVTTAGDGTTSGTPTLLVDGTDIGIGTADFTSVHLVSDTITIGGATVNAGDILVSVDQTIASGFAGLSGAVNPYDVVALNVTVAGASTSATGTLVFEGVDIKLDSGAEAIEAFSLLSTATNAPAITPPTGDAGGTYDVDEGSSIALDGSGSFDADGSIVSYEWDFDYDGVTFDVDDTGIAPTFSAATLDGLSTKTVALRVTDDAGNQSIDTAVVTIHNVAPTITVGGSGTANEDLVYSITLGATDPGDDSVTEWRVDWGDGNFETFTTPFPGTFDHTYARGGTYDVLVSATDEDGTWVQNKLYVPGYLGTGQVFVFDPASGDQANQFGSGGSFNSPLQAVVGPNGNLFVTALGTGSIREFAPDGTDLLEFATGLNTPTGLAFDSNGNLWVGENTPKKLTQLDASGNEIQSLSVGFRPTGMEFHSNGKMYVVGYDTGELYEFDGTTATSIASGMINPEDIAIGNDGNVYVADRGNNLVKVFNTAGSLVDSFAANDIYGLEFGPDGLLYITSYTGAGISNANDRVMRYEDVGATWAYKDDFTNGGMAGVNLDGPTYLTFLPEHQVAVAHAADTPSITAASTDEHTQTSSGLVITRNAADGDEVTHYKITGITGGTLYKNDGTTQITDGTFITIAEGASGLKFTPSGDFAGTGTFNIQASLAGNDGGLGGNTAAANISISEINDAPVRSAGTVNNLTVNEDSGFTSLGLGTLAYGPGGGADESGQTLTYNVTTIPSAALGSIYLADETTVVSTGVYTLAQIQGMKFKPVDHANGGPATFEWTVTDNGTTNSVADPLVLTESLTITVDPQPDLPVIGGAGDGAIDDTATVQPFSAVTIEEYDGDNVTTVVTLSGGDANGLFTAASLTASGFTKTGVGEYSLAVTTPAAAQAAIRQLVFDPTENQVASGSTVITTFTIAVDDGGPAQTDNTTDVTVTSVNDAPTLTAGTLTSITEDNFTPSGESVATIFSSSFSDVDNSSSLDGIVVVGNTANSVTEGKWQYSSNSGTNWFDIGTVDDTGNALAIAAGSKIRFVPVLNYNGTPTSLVVRGLDDSFAGSYSTTTGSETREVVDTSSPVASSPFSNSTTTLGTTVDPDNDLPQIGGAGDNSIDDTATVQPFASVTIADVEGDNVTTVVTLSGGDANGLFTAASLSASGFSKTGAGEYSLATTTPAAAQAAIRQLVFDPTENQVASGSTVMTTFTIAVDDGGPTQTDNTSDVTVTSVNDAPTLTAGNLASVVEESSNPPGATVASLFAASFTDPDASSSLDGIIIVGNAANPVTEGKWQYSSNSGTNWFDIGTVDDTGNGLAIAAGSLIRFLPEEDFAGTPTSLVVRGLDDSFSGSYSTTAGSEVRQLVDTSTPTANSAFSDPTTTLGTSVTGEDDPPAIGGTADNTIDDTAIVQPFAGVTIGEADGENVSVTVNLSDGDDNGLFTAASLSASGFTKTGAGQYNLGSSSSAVAQTAIRQLVFDPTENQVASGATVMTTFTISVSDGGAPTVNNSTDVTVTSVNDAPSIGPGALPASAQNDLTPPGATISSMFNSSFSDVDASSSLSGIAVVGNTANPVTEGIWQYSSDGTTWSNIGAVDDAGNGLAIAAGSRIRFVPVLNYNGAPTSLVVRGLDDSYSGSYSTTAGAENRQFVDTSTPTANSPFSNPTTTLGTTITPNAAPMIGGTTGGQAVDDNQTRSPFSSVTITDAENDNLSTVVTLSGGDANGTFTTTSLVASGFVKTGAGEYTLASTSPAAAQAAIRQLVFDPTENQVAVGSTVNTIFTITVDDGGPASNSATTVVATSINDAPTIGDGSLVPSAEDNFTPPGETINNLVGGSFSDADASSTFDGAVVVGNSANATTEGKWQYSSDAGANWFDIGAVNDSGSGLALSAATRVRFVPVGDYNGTPTALSVRGLDDTYTGLFSDTSAGETRRTIDTSSPSGTSSFSLNATSIGATITPGNDQPTLADRTINATANATYVGDNSLFLGASNDIDGDALTAAMVTATANGTVTIAPDGSFTYTPNPGFSGTDTFQWEAFDGTVASLAGTVTINIDVPIIITPPPVDPTPDPEPETEPDPADEPTDEEEETTEVTPPPSDAPTSGGGPKTTRQGTVDVLVKKIIEEEEIKKIGTDFVSLVAPETESKTVVEETQFAAPLRQREDSRAASQLDAVLSQIDFVMMSQSGEMWNKMDYQRKMVEAQIQGDLIVVGAAGAAASSFTVGVVAWAIRSGFLLSGLLAQMPAWQSFDALTIMQGLGGGRDETLEQMMDRRKRELSRGH